MYLHFPDLAEFQGTIEWSVRGIYQSMFGWFNGFPEGLFPLTPAEQAKRWLDLMSTKRLLNSAKQAMKKGMYPKVFQRSETFSHMCHFLIDSVLYIERNV